MSKGDVIGWAAVLGGVTLLGFLAYRGISNIFPGLGGNDDTDIFGNPTAASEEARHQEAITKSSEHSQDLAQDVAKAEMGGYPQAYIDALKDYQREVNEFYAVQNAPERDWLGRLTQPYQQSYNKELAEANQAYGNLQAAINQYWGVTQ
jgi:hypothetical protein